MVLQTNYLQHVWLVLVHASVAEPLAHHQRGFRLEWCGVSRTGVAGDAVCRASKELVFVARFDAVGWRWTQRLDECVAAVELCEFIAFFPSIQCVSFANEPANFKKAAQVAHQTPK
jgi:hypothetical protein